MPQTRVDPYPHDETLERVATCDDDGEVRHVEYRRIAGRTGIVAQRLNRRALVMLTAVVGVAVISTLGKVFVELT